MNFLAIEEIKKQSVTFINYIKSLFHPIGKYKPINNKAGFKEWLTKNIDPNELEHVLIVEKATSSNYKLDLFSHLFSDELVAAIESTKKSNPKETIIYSNCQVYEDEINYFYVNQKFDFIVCDVSPAEMKHGQAIWAYEILFPLLQPEAHLLISSNAARSNSDNLKKQVALRSHLSTDEHQNHLALSSSPHEDAYYSLYRHCSFFDLVSMCQMDNTASQCDTAWLLLRRRKVGSRLGRRALYSQRETKTFALGDLKALYLALTEHGCRTLTANAFHDAAVKQPREGNCLIKHDIHHDLRRTINLSEMEADVGVRSVYFAIPEHELSKKYFGSRYMWHHFHRIVAMGHELALHLDLHDLILKHGGIIEGIRATIRIFSENGFNIETANLHGNTKLRKRYGSPKAFIKQLDSDTESLRHIYPICDERFEKFQAALSLESLARDLGIINWIDSEFFRAGKKLRVPTNCTDNTGAFRMGHNRKNILKSEPFKIGRAFCEKAAAHCNGSSTLFLIHPQYYELDSSNLSR